jgi:hypothetical protein
MEDKDTLDICDMVTCVFCLPPHRVRCRCQLGSVRFRLHTGSPRGNCCLTDVCSISHGRVALQVNLLGASPRKAAAQNTFLPLAAAALLVTGTFCLALSSGGQGTGRAAAIERNGVFGRIGGKQPSCNRAAGKLRSAALSI